MTKKSTYKTSRKYRCPYCELKETRDKLVDHVDRKHTDILPEGYSAARAIYDSINDKNYNICMICKKPVYKWNEKINRYYNLCDDPKCRAKVREIALERHMKVYNKPTLLNDPEHQEKMLANRKISGTYTFSDGGKCTFTGQYERKALEFMDLVLNIPSKDIQSPGPVFEYKYKGETHKWITDIYYIPANLVIEVKDGGDNPNNRSMESYREKQISKETMITELGTFNYIRLTNNNFTQLLNIFADMKNEALTNENPKPKIHINEEVGGLPVHRKPEAYVVPYGMNNVFAGFAYGDLESDNISLVDDNDTITSLSKEVFKENYDLGPILFYINEDNIENKVDSIKLAIIKEMKANPLYFVEALLGRKLSSWEEIFLSESFKYYDKEKESQVNHLIENAIRELPYTKLDSVNEVCRYESVSIHSTPKGYCAFCNANGIPMLSDYTTDMKKLESSGLIDMMRKVVEEG